MKRFASAAVGALMLLGAACSDNPVAPQPQLHQRLFNAAEGDDVTPLARYRFGAPLNGSLSKVIGPNGGSLTLAGFEVVIPQGALSRAVWITISLPLEAVQTNRVWAEFGPHGIQFEKPVTLKLPLSGTTAEVDAANVHVLWYNGVDWVRLPSQLTGDGRIQTQTTHFSEYGTEEGENGKGITLGGY